MLIPNQQVEMIWTRNKKYYMDLGYKYTGFRKMFLVKVEDLPYGSKKKVKVKCDNCGKIMQIEWRDYFAHRTEEFGDLCFNCVGIKRMKTCINKYGVENPSQVKEFQDKRKQTHIDKYGVENAFESEEIKSKIKQSNFEKYGCEYTAQVPEVKERIRETNLEKYGFTSPNKSDVVKEKIRQTCLKKYGVDSYLKTDEARIKINQTLCKRGKVPTSRQQLEVCNILQELYGNCELNYPVDRCALDCMVEINDIKIDVEYDGAYWHRNTTKKDAERNYFLMTQGYKILRIKGNYGIPTKEQLKEAIDYLVKDNHKLTRITLDI